MKIFFSYGHDDNAPFVERIKQELEKRHPDYSIWFDKSNIHAGDDWRRSIYSGISESDAVLACLSRHSVREPGVCLDELRIAAGERSCEIASILLESPEEVRPPLSISHIQYLDLSDWKEKRAAGDAVFQPWFEEKLQAIDAMVSKGKAFSGEVEQLRAKLMPRQFTGSYLDRMQGLLKDGFVGREWLFNDIQDWLEHDRRRKVFCITGEPGIGKSALVAQFAAQNKVQVVGIHFCAAGSSLDEPRSVILSLAFQMGTRLSAYRRYLLTHDFDFARLSEEDLFSKLITEACSFGIDGGRQPCLLIVDGLDEASGELARFIAQHYRELPDWLYFLVTSRPNDRHVKAHLEAMNPRVLSATDERNEADARLYVRNWLDEAGVEDARRDQIEKHVLRASAGNFRYLSFLRGMVQNGVIDLDEFVEGEVFPRGLSSLYQSCMDRIFPNGRGFSEQARPVLSMLACCGATPLAFGVLLPVLKKNYGLTESAVRDTLGRLGSLVRINANRIPQKQTVQIFHKSVSDWLLSDSNTQYCLDREEASTFLIRYLWDKMTKICDSEELLEEFRDSHAALLGQLLLDKLAPGEGLTPERLDAFDGTLLKELGMTKKKWEKNADIIDEYTQYYDPKNKGICEPWILLDYLCCAYFYGKINDYTVGASIYLLSLFPVEKFPEWATFFAEDQYKLTIEKHGEESKERFSALDNLLDVYTDHPDPEYEDKAKALIQSAIPDAQKKLGKNSKELADLYTQLAKISLYDEDEKRVEKYHTTAISIYKKRFTLWKKKLSADQASLCQMLCDTPDKREQLDVKQKRDLEELRKNAGVVVGLNISLMNYAQFLNEKGSHAEALQTMNEVEGTYYLFDEEPPGDYASIKSDILQSLKRFDEAILLLQKSFEKDLRDYGADNDSTLVALSNLALGYANKAEACDDKEALEKAIEIQEQVVTGYASQQSDGFDTVQERHALAEWLYKAGRIEEALHQSQMAYESALKNRGINTLTIHDAWYTMIECKIDLAPSEVDFVEEMKIFLHAEEDYWGKYDKHTFETYKMLLTNYIFVVDTSKDPLLDVCRDYADIAQKMYGENSGEFLDACLHLGWQLHVQAGEHEQALEMFRKCRSIADAQGDEADEYLSDAICLCLVCVLFQLKKYSECVAQYREGKKLIEAHGFPPLLLRLATADAGRAYAALGKKRDALKYLERAQGLAKEAEEEEEAAQLEAECQKLRNKGKRA